MKHRVNGFAPGKARRCSSKGSSTTAKLHRCSSKSKLLSVDVGNSLIAGAELVFI
jgi:hypothetical protein